MPINRFIWADSGAGLSERAWELAQRTGAAWVGNNAQAHISLMRSTVRDELAVAMEQRGMPRQHMAAAVQRALKQWGLLGQAEQDPTTLSTGQTRRVAIATALLARPDALVLDCPCDGLDATAVNLLLSVLRDFPGEVIVFDRMHNPLADAAAVCEHLSGRREAPPRLEAGVPAAAAEEGLTGLAGFEARDVLIRRGSTTVGPFNVTAPAGRITHLPGPNGSGKTSLFLAALGLVPYQGQISDMTFGWAPTDMDAAITAKTVLEEVSLGAGEQQGWEMLEFAGLSDVAEVHPLDLPAARRRIVLVTAAMVRAPQVVLLDEPTVGLDAPHAQQLASLMRRYAAGEYGGAPAAILWTCHDPAFAAAV